MAVLRINKKEKNFLILDKTCLNDAELSWGAKGLHSYLMGLPQDWQVKVKDLTSRATNGRDSVKGLLSELKDAGYISQEWIRDEITKQYKSLEYIVHELPQKNHPSEPLEPEKRETDYQSPVNPVTEKAPLISINRTNNTNNKVLKAAAMTVESRDEKTKENPAAAFFVELNSFFHKAQPKPQTAVLHSLPSSDALIGESLSPKQIERTRALVGRLEASGLIS
ncbi:MAG: hypothetical protein K2X39_00695, partial [Silvanigrellaceae bacterium]|nr:hypothetical protein [Silvanigrellaceae bacterium]